MKRLLLLFTLIILITACQPQDINPKLSCEQDSDCVTVKADCCGCTAGGNAIVISKSYKQEYITNLEQECKGMMCTAMISNHPSCSAEPVCEAKQCLLK